MARENYIVCPRCKLTCPPTTERCDCGYCFTEVQSNTRTYNQYEYTSKDNTPLRFHKFTMYVALPLGFLSCIIAIINLINSAGFTNLLIVVDILVYVLLAVLFMIAFKGFIEWKRYGISCLKSIIVIEFIYILALVVLELVNSTDILSTNMGSLFSLLVYFIIIHVYYGKRKKLFNWVSVF